MAVLARLFEIFPPERGGRKTTIEKRNVEKRRIENCKRDEWEKNTVM